MKRAATLSPGIAWPGTYTVSGIGPARGETLPAAGSRMGSVHGLKDPGKTARGVRDRQESGEIFVLDIDDQ